MSIVSLRDSQKDLRRPFGVEAVRVKPLTKPGTDKKAAAAFYIDARLVAERLNAVVGPENWEDEYRVLAAAEAAPALFYPVECSLLVCGVKKTDVGQGPDQRVDEKAWKTAYSDALKRAAVKFGIGAYLYAIPRLRAEVMIGQNGKAAGFSKEGQKTLRAAYGRWLANTDLNHFGEAFEHAAAEGSDDE